MNQSRMDSFMESVVNIIIGLAISTVANYLLLQLYLGYPMHLGTNALISGVFTAISLIRSYSLRRAFNGRSVWSAIKDKFNAHQVHHHEGAGMVDRHAVCAADRIVDLRRSPDVAPRHRKRSYHFWGIREQAAH